MRIRKQQRVETASGAVCTVTALAEVKDVRSMMQGEVNVARACTPSRPCFSWLDKLRYSKGFQPAEPHVGIEDFVWSLGSRGSMSSHRDSQSGSPAVSCSFSLDKCEGFSDAVVGNSEQEGVTAPECAGSGIADGERKRKPLIRDHECNVTGTLPSGLPSRFHAVKLEKDSSCASELTMSASHGSLSRHLHGSPQCAVRVSLNGSSLTKVNPTGETSGETSDPRLQSDASFPKPDSVKTAVRGREEEEARDIEALKARPLGKVFADPFGMEKFDAREEGLGIVTVGFSVKKNKRKQEKPRLCRKASDLTEKDTNSSLLQGISERDMSSSDDLQRETVGKDLDGQVLWKQGSSTLKRTGSVISSRKKGFRTPHFGEEREDDFTRDVMPPKAKARKKAHANRDATSAPADGPVRKRPKVVQPGRLGNSVPQNTQQRSRRKRRVSPASIGAGDFRGVPELSSRSSPPKAPTCTALAPDHPANQPKESLLYSNYQVFLQAGKSGLTAREAVSRILEQGLPGLHEGGVVPRVQVGKLLRNSPYFMELEEGRFALFSAIVGGEETVSHDDSMQASPSRPEKTPKQIEAEERTEAAKKARQKGTWQYWAALAAIKRARTGKVWHKEPGGGGKSGPTVKSHIALNRMKRKHQESAKEGLVSSEEPLEGSKGHVGEPLQSGSRKRLKLVKQEGILGLGNRCNRSDGKGWHCPLLAKVGYHLCDHHLDRLRYKGSCKLKRPIPMMVEDEPPAISPSSVSADQLRTLGDSWLVRKKAVGRARTGRPSPYLDKSVVGKSDSSIPQPPGSLDSVSPSQVSLKVEIP